MDKKSYRHTSSFHREYKKALGITKLQEVVEVVRQTKQDDPSSPINDPSREAAEILLEVPIIRSQERIKTCNAEHEIPPEDVAINVAIRNWAIAHKMTHIAINDLLKILKSNGISDLPGDCRALLQTKSKIQLSELGTGKYWYYGIQTNLRTTLHSIDKNMTISLIFNIDGISPFKSSAQEFWPILFRIEELPELQPMVAAVYYGTGKPPLTEYFEPFVEELNELVVKGMNINQNHISLVIKYFVCDTPARCFIKGIVGANSANGACTKCTVVGDWDKKGRHMSYSNIHCTSRTNKSFRNGSDEDHHKQETPLLKLPIDMVKDVIIADSLHLFDLGVMRRCINGWSNGSYNFRTKFSAHQIAKLSTYLESINSTKPCDINRAIRGLKFLKYWKGSEYRTLLLYTGMVALKEFLDEEVYEHFVLLSCAVRILSCKEYMKYLQIAKTMLEEYIEKFVQLYGADSISSNIHNLCHAVEDVANFGPLPYISSYPFENYLGQFKNLIRTGHLPLSQIAKRITESAKVTTLNIKPKQCFPCATGSKIDQKHVFANCNGAYTKVFLNENFVLKNDDKNKWFLTKDLQIVEMLYGTYYDGSLCVCGTAIKTKANFFEKPFQSSRLDIYASRNIAYTSLAIYSLCSIKCKLFSIKYKNMTVYVPIIHTL